MAHFLKKVVSVPLPPITTAPPSLSQGQVVYLIKALEPYVLTTTLPTVRLQSRNLQLYSVYKIGHTAKYSFLLAMPYHLSLTGLGGGTYTVVSLDILVSVLLSLPFWILNGFITNETKIGLSVSEKQICTLCIFAFF